MIKLKKMLVLVDAEDIVLKNGNKKVKYTFILKDNSLLTAYDPTQETGGEYKSDVVDSDGNWNEIDAKEFVFTPKVWDGKTTLKLVSKGEKKGTL